MSSIEKSLRVGVVGIGLMTGCSTTAPPTASPTPDTRPRSAPAVPAVGETAAMATHSTVPLGPPGPVHSWAEVRLQAAHRLMASNPRGTYAGDVVEPLLAIPVLEIELNGNGSIRAIVVLRHPQEARDTSKLAEEVVRRAAPFGDVSHLPKPWRFTETFLFNDQRKFKPRTLDQ